MRERGSVVIFKVAPIKVILGEVAGLFLRYDGYAGLITAIDT